MKRSSLFSSLAICVLIIIFLSVLSYIPGFKIGNYEFKRVDLLSGIRSKPRPEDYTTVQDDSDHVDSLASADLRFEKASTHCKPGLTCIEDYSADSTGLHYFLAAMVELKKSDKLLRIAFYGDSFIEGDVLCGNVRDTLQTLFGGRGVGYVPITSQITGFRNTIKHAYKNYKTHSIVKKKDSLASVELGPAGYSFEPLEGNWLQYKVSKQRYLREFSVMKLYYKNEGSAKLYYTLNDTLRQSTALRKSENLVEWKYEKANAKSVEFTFGQADSLQLYGASFESTKGIYVDNFSMRGNSGVGLYQIPDKMLTQFNKYRDYKLIVLQYGLNVIAEDSGRYSWYADRMITVIEKIKSAFPKASVVLLSVSDRATNQDGQMKTIKSIPALRNAQRHIAKVTGICFWDLYQTMGGENSMAKYVEAEPALAAKDYTHLTFRGGKMLGQQLVNSLLHEVERYENKKTVQ